eukprot:TRINITY_DN4112_c0_g2_i1.p1 TRINITY_DN4112_c0_g2~~TRINITY_DN4112_c0_g2_i1.p1  ORF type:complete len:189 (+),score=33.64 TRINITY_DN4112_c0_g2_i1:44-610(+)
MNREKSKNYFENKITAQPFENATNKQQQQQQAVPVPDITQSPSGGIADPIYQTKEKPFKIIAGVTLIPITIVIVISMIIVIYKGIETPTYLPLIINFVFIILITGLLYFWYFRGTMPYTMIWYIIIYAILTVIQCIFYDIFILVELTPSTPPIVTPHTIPSIPINGTNTTKHHLFTNPTKLAQLDLSN